VPSPAASSHASLEPRETLLTLGANSPRKAGASEQARKVLAFRKKRALRYKGR
jgi:hypothetical protein